MASGKQLSFAYGEVSPSLRYKSDAVSYAQGLGKLRNMYVRRAGGVSNRPGFEYIKSAQSQENIPSPGGPMGVKAFTYWSAGQSKWVTIEYAEYVDGDGYGFVVDGLAPAYLSLVTPTISPLPSNIKFTPLKEDVFVTPQIEMTGGSAYNISIGMGDNLISADYGLNMFSLPIGTTVVSGYTGLSPFLPVSYLLTGIMENGTEVLLHDLQSGAIASPSTAPATICHPHASLTATIAFTFPAAVIGVKSFNLYRSAGRGGLTASFYVLAGRSRYDQAALTLTFSDYGASDLSVTPPVDEEGVYIGSLRGAETAAYYQQRLLMGMKHGTGAAGNGVPETIKAGDILASKLGAPRQIIAPTIYSNNGAFQFSIPITDGTPCHALLAMERLMAFTERGVYVIRGGEQGSLTPTSVNPLLVSEEGCSTTVEPKMSGRRGYFVNSSHTKLMGIQFGLDGNMEVKESSLFSDHLFNEDIVQLEVISGSEDTVYLLRRDGKLVRVTTTEEGTNGFSLVETDGYIESIYRGKAKRPYAPNATDLANSEKYYDVLMCYVIRNGFRLLERLNIRDDRHREGEFFADCYTAFGYRLSDNGSEGYAKLAVGTSTPTWGGANKVNIGDSTTAVWTAGTTIKVYVDTNSLVGDVVHFFYEDATGKEQVLRFTSDGAGQTVSAFLAGYGYYYEGTFSDDVPDSLRHVEGQSITLAKKKALRTRWLPATNVLANFALDLYGPILAAANTGDGTAETYSAPVTVVADGAVLSSPNNPNGNTLLMAFDVDRGDISLHLPDYFCFGYVGIPYTSEFETLDLEASDNRTLTDSQKLLNAVGVGFHETRGGFYGMQGRSLADMEENYFSEDDVNFSVETKNYNGHQTIHIPSEWNGPGRINIKQVDPLPMTILAVYPKGISGD